MLSILSIQTAARSRRILGALLLLLTLAAQALQGSKSKAANRSLRPATVQDAILMNRWANPGYFADDSAHDAGLFSPDRRYFLVLVKKGNLGNNTNEYSLLLFRTENAFDRPRPRVLLSMASSSNRSAIADVKWLNDSRSITYLGENPGQIPQVYRFDIPTGRITRLTSHNTAVVRYDVSGDGNEVVYEADPPNVVSVSRPETRRFGVVITTQYPTDLLLGTCSTLARASSFYKQLFVQLRGQASFRVTTKDFVVASHPLSISPNGRYAVVDVYLAKVPRAWKAYEDPLLRPYITERVRTGTASNINQYMLIDTASRRITPLVDAPTAWQPFGIAWGQNSRSIVLSGIYLPLDVSNAAERPIRRKRTFVAQISIPGKRITPITDRNLQVVHWDRSGVLVVRAVAPQRAGEEEYRYTSIGWRPVIGPANRAAGGPPIAVTLDQDMNSPPKIFVSDHRTGRKDLLLDLNPQFRRVQFAHEEVIRWRATDGHEMIGGLYLPPNAIRGARYPLVIQTHGFDPHRFWIDGPYSSAFAAQPLADSGFVVLQIGNSADPEQDRIVENTSEEAPRQMAAYQGAINYLGGQGWIDRNRVGIIGFSRTVYYVAYTLTHSKYKFAAATLADGFDGGYVNSLLWGIPGSYNSVNGGPPSGPTMAAWLKNSPGFNLDKVRTPVRIEYYGAAGVLGGWQFFAGLTDLDRPVDFVWLPFGTHELVKPWERLASLQGNLDWFRFWLQGNEDQSPWAKNQNARWEQLRSLQHRSAQAAE